MECERNEREFRRLIHGYMPSTQDRLNELREKALAKNGGLKGDSVFEYINLEIHEGLRKATSEIEKLQAENKKLIEALGFYADEENWCSLINGSYNIGKIWIKDPQNDMGLILESGKLARKALKELDK